MSTPLATLYLALRNRIRQQVPALRHIDQDMGQLKQQKPPVAWPCLLIDLASLKSTNLAGNIQMCSIDVVLQLGFQAVSSAAGNVPILYAEKALGYYELEDALHQALHGWSPGGPFGGLMRVAATSVRRADNCRVRELTYTLAFEDHSTQPSRHTHPVTLHLETGI